MPVVDAVGRGSLPRAVTAMRLEGLRAGVDVDPEGSRPVEARGGFAGVVLGDGGGERLPGPGDSPVG